MIPLRTRHLTLTFSYSFFPASSLWSTNSFPWRGSSCREQRRPSDPAARVWRDLGVDHAQCWGKGGEGIGNRSYSNSLWQTPRINHKGQSSVWLLPQRRLLTILTCQMAFTLETKSNTAVGLSFVTSVYFPSPCSTQWEFITMTLSKTDTAWALLGTSPVTPEIGRTSLNAFRMHYFPARPYYLITTW